MMLQNDIIYIAGFLDGEGWIGLQKMKKKGKWNYLYFCPRIGVTNTNKAILEWLKDKTGCGYVRVSITNLKLLNRKPCWVWDVATKKDIISLLKLITPYLRIKKEVALLILEFEGIQESWKKKRLTEKRKDKRAVPEELKVIRESYYQRIKMLNKRGK